jgi:transcriptional regulator with XRE-family HTH domain
MPDTKRPHSIDVIVGANVRRIRMQRQISQEMLASKIGVTFQQVQKNEKGINRISASRLQMIADALQCQLLDLFDGVASGTTAEPVHELSKEAMRAAAYFDAIPEQNKRDALLKLMGSLVTATAQPL